MKNPPCTPIYEQIIRGGVEDTRLEAKAKDTKKSEAKAKAKDSLSEDRNSRGQGQEQPFRGQTLLSPFTLVEPLTVTLKS